MTIFEFIMSSLTSLKTCLQGVSLDFWNEDSNKTMWLFFSACCGGTIVFKAMYSKWNNDGKGWNK